MAVEAGKKTPEPKDNPETESPLPQDGGSGAAAPPQPLHQPSPPPPLTDVSSAPLPADAASKRQRRPNVRLNEIGSETSLANVVEYLLKRKGNPGDRRGRPPKLAAPGILPKKSKHPHKANSNDKAGAGEECHDDGSNVGDAGGGHRALDAEPDRKTPFKKPKLYSKGKNRKTSNLGNSQNIATAITKHAKRPKVIFPRAVGNSNNWMHKTADGFLEAADGAVYACSDTDKHAHSPSPHAQPGIFSFESGSPKVLKKTQAAPKRRKKEGTNMKRATECMHKDGAIDEKEEPSSSALQELRVQGPVWERGLPPLDEKVREWLQKIGLEKYATLFQYHEVSDDVVPLLTMDDLKEMGIQAVGARRKFYSEITKCRQSMMLLPDEPLAEEK